MKSKNISVIITIILLLVVLPTASYFFLRSGVKGRDQRYVQPFSYQNMEGDTIRPVFTDQLGDTLTNDLADGKVILSGFIYNRCYRFTFCDSIPFYFQKIQNHFSEEKDLELLTYSIDPENDTTEVLREWANKWNANPEKWHFVRADRYDLYQIVLGEYFGEIKYAEGNIKYMEPDHKVILIGKDGLIKGYYELYNEEDMNTIIESIEAELKDEEQS